jgi:hypothetical protein
MAMQPLVRSTIALAMAALAIASAAHAGLGGTFASVQADRAQFRASMASAQTSAWSVHTLTLANRGVVREFARGDGTVFAVAWRGPGRPDLRQLLGERFETFQSDNTSPSGRRTRQPLGVNRDDFVAHSAGHSGAFWGFAYLPKMAPAGFSTSDLKSGL